jgi:hypothetical protein
MVGLNSAAMGQIRLVCPNGYYLASDYKGYPYQPQTQSAPATQDGGDVSPNCNVHCQFEKNFAKEKGLTKDTNSATGFLEIDYDGEWEGSILDSNLTNTSHDGVGISTIPFPCSDDGHYSVVVQKYDSNGTLHIKVVKEGNILKDGETDAAYGLVAVSGSC